MKWVGMCAHLTHGYNGVHQMATGIGSGQRDARCLPDSGSKQL